MTKKTLTSKLRISQDPESGVLNHACLPFIKMQGLGNDFVVLDAIQKPIILSEKRIQQMADRHFGIGFDQLLLIESSNKKDNDFNYRIFDADGSEVGQCGNGARCVARYLYDHRLTHKRAINLATLYGSLSVKIQNNNEVGVTMGVPTFIPAEIPFIATDQKENYTLEVGSRSIEISAVGIGNPHAVIEVDDIDEAPVNEWGPKIERHPRFPDRTNVGFMELINPEEISLRVFERGVGETLACGSGACAAVAVGRLKHQLKEKVKVHLPGGTLTVIWEGKNSPIWLIGPAVEVFVGYWPL